MKPLTINKEVKRKKFKISNNTLDKINIIHISKIMQSLQNPEFDLSHPKFIFLWKNATTKSVQMNPESRLHFWLCSIQFSTILAIILEIFENNVHYMLTDREKIIASISLLLKIKKDHLYNLIEDIQNLLIKFGKVKKCENGKVVIMYDV